MIRPVFETKVIVSSNDRNMNLTSVFYRTFKNCLIVIMTVCHVPFQLAKGVKNNMYKRKQVDNEHDRYIILFLHSFYIIIVLIVSEIIPLHHFVLFLCVE